MFTTNPNGSFSTQPQVRASEAEVGSYKVHANSLTSPGFYTMLRDQLQAQSVDIIG